MLHYVFNWVEVSSNVVVNDEQFIHFLFVLIPVASHHDVFIECTTVLEDVLAQKTKSMLELKKIQILKDVVQVKILLKSTCFENRLFSHVQPLNFPFYAALLPLLCQIMIMPSLKMTRSKVSAVESVLFLT